MKYMSNFELNLPTVAGVLLIIVSILSIITAAQLLTTDWDLQELMDDEDIDEDILDTVEGYLGAIIGACGLIFLGLAVTGFVGGICAIKGIHRTFVMVASVLSIFTFGPMRLGSLLAVVALILLIISKDDYGVDPHTDHTWDQQTCRECGGYMEFIEQYGRWYCYRCKKYGGIDVGKKESWDGKVCPDCNGHMEYIDQYDRWYCYRCEKYG